MNRTNLGYNSFLDWDIFKNTVV